MSTLVERLRQTASAFSNAAFMAGREPDQEEAGIITDLREAADRIEQLEQLVSAFMRRAGATALVVERRPEPNIERVNEALDAARRV